MKPPPANQNAIRSRYDWIDTFPSGRLPIFSQAWSWNQSELPRHDHNFFEIQLCLEGTATHRSENEEAPFKKGYCYLMRPNRWHSLHHSKKVKAVFTAFDLKILATYLSWTVHEPGLNDLLWRKSSTGVFKIHLSPEDFSFLKPLFIKMAKQDELNSPLPPSIILGNLLLILSTLGTQWQKENKTVASIPIHPVIKRVFQLLEEDLNHPWTTSTIAKRFRMSPAYLCRLFLSATQMTVMNYLESRRLERAATLLRQTKHPIATISESVGMLDQNYFSRRFRKSFKLTPSEYRSQSRIK